MKPQTILLLSILCNIGLLAGVARFSKSTSMTGSSASKPVDAVVAEGIRTPPKQTNTAPALETVKTNTPFSWREIEAADFKEYIAHLRSVDCPEETIRDIIVAEVNKLYAGKMRELRGPEREYKYWKAQNNWASKEDREYQKKYRALEKEKSDLLVELLGVDPVKEKRKEEGYVDYWERMYNFLPEDKQAKAREIQEKFQDMQQEIYRGGEQDDEDRKKLREIRQQQLAEMSQILTPEELQEYDIRTSQIASQMRYDLDSFSPTAEEFKAIFGVRKAREEDLAYVYDQDDKAAQEKRTKAVEETNLQVKELLGADRYEEYKLAQDYSYKSLWKIAQRYELPEGTAKAVYDMKKTAEEAANKVRADKSLTSEQRKEALKAIQAETEKAATEHLGEKGFKNYQNRGGYWVRNLGQ